MDEVTNKQRAGWAEEALDVFADATYSKPRFSEMHREDQETCIRDLLTDLEHFSRRNGFDFAALAATATASHAEEVETDPEGDAEECLMPGCTNPRVDGLRCVEHQNQVDG